MIISRISGGIGNQLFQYALGRSIAQKNATKLVLDIHAYGRASDAHRSFTLDRFSLPISIAGPADFKEVGIPDPTRVDLFARLGRKLYRWIERSKPLSKRKVVLEPSFVFCEEVLRIDHSCYLSGVWQSEKYFLSIRDTLRDEIILSNGSDAYQKLLRAIETTEAIAVHVRRGDYVAHSKTNQLHGTCGPDYYARAIALITTKVKNPVFYIFSDDIAWTKENIVIDYPVVYVSSEGLPDYEELMLMSRCRHQIIANSSFSWWAAWLNPNNEKHVIAPKRWFNTPIDTRDLLPESWITI